VEQLLHHAHRSLLLSPALAAIAGSLLAVYHEYVTEACLLLLSRVLVAVITGCWWLSSLGAGGCHHWVLVAFITGCGRLHHRVLAAVITGARSRTRTACR